MLGKNKILSIIGYALSHSKADQTEVLLNSYHSYLTRFANSQVHQNVAEHNNLLSVRVIIGKRIGVSSTNSLDKKSIEKTLQRAFEIAKHQQENPDFISLPKASKRTYKDVKTYFKSTAEFNEIQRKERVREMIDIIKGKGLRAFGSFTTGISETVVANSLGVFAYNIATDAYSNVVAIGKDSSGYAQNSSRDVRKVDTKGIAEKAADKAILGRDPIELPPGNYPVLLESLATAELIEFLGWLGMGAKAFYEGRSFMSGRLGERITSDSITIYDDAYDKRGFTFPFDFEGVPKRRVLIIDEGVAQKVVYDSLTAFKHKRKSTGHALPAPNPSGPIPTNLILSPGESEWGEMVKSTDRGILITRFHYTNSVDPKRTIITGMTRDGTFLVERGEITKGVKNLRFTQSILEALSEVSMIEDRLTLIGGGAGYEGRFATGVLVPALKIEKFTFSGKTTF